MGRMVNGQWTTQWYQPDSKGHFVRDSTIFHDRVRADGSSAYPAASGRYHIYAAWACPWAHRTLIMRRLKKLESVVSISVVDPFMGDDGWAFSDAPGTVPDTVCGARFLREIYAKAKPDYTGRVTVPVLWDKQTSRIVNNESREIMRMLDHAFDAFGDATVDFCPRELEATVDQTIDAIYEPINNGVYRAGFATTQQAYDEAVTRLFNALDHWEEVLAEQPYLCGERLTEADWCMFTTLVRFDVVYHYHFKCNIRRIQDYPNLWRYLRGLYNHPGVADTCNFDHIKQHYFRSHPTVNPTRIVPQGPRIDWSA